MLFLLCINDLPVDVIRNITIYADDTNLYSKCDKASNLWEQLELASELEVDLRDTVVWGRKWLFDFIARKKTLVLLMWNWIVMFLGENHLLKCWSWLSLLNWIGELTWSLLLKLPPRKLEPWFVLWSFLLLRLFCISTNLSYGHAWSTAAMSGLVLLAATWNC